MATHFADFFEIHFADFVSDRNSGAGVGFGEDGFALEYAGTWWTHSAAGSDPLQPGIMFKAGVYILQNTMVVAAGKKMKTNPCSISKN